ncbi:hypothetical protein J1N35_011653 [Gossypium stocksii]|uniref:RNase H type-1 domain-containing protein n=1 Tax=Gossypium stocksii TaxID=47602 RepID=A0A9D3W4G3_9ROSI|nr:hypothetical protein J1N35_011653 [Gossypium stocksii]
MGVDWSILNENMDFRSWLNVVFQNKGHDVGEIAATTAWALWQARNKRIMEEKRQSVQDICSIIFSIIREMRELRNKTPIQVKTMIPTWKPPQEPFVKVNCDAAFKATLHQSYSDFVIRNNKGDSRTMIVKINQVLLDYSDMGTYIEEIKIKASSFQHISFHHVDRRANMVAHMIAKEGISLPKDRFWVEELPEAAKAFLARDLSGMSS